MFKDSSFNTNISIENIRTENFISYIYLKFLSVKPTPIGKSKAYLLWIENLDTGLFDLALNDLIWIDRFDNSSMGNFKGRIDIERNKTICVPVKLYMQSVSNNRFLYRCRFHLKPQGIKGENTASVWISDDLLLPSREVLVPEPSCKRINILSDGKLSCKFKLKYPTARDETNFNNYLIPYVLFYDNNQLVETEVVESNTSEEVDTFIFTSTNVYAYDETKKSSNPSDDIIPNKVNKIAIEIRFLNGTLASRQEIILDSFQNFAAFYANENTIEKCRALGVTYETPDNENNPADTIIKAKRIKDIYIQP